MGLLKWIFLLGITLNQCSGSRGQQVDKTLKIGDLRNFQSESLRPDSVVSWLNNYCFSKIKDTILLRKQLLAALRYVESNQAPDPKFEDHVKVNYKGIDVVPLDPRDKDVATDDFRVKVLSSFDKQEEDSRGLQISETKRKQPQRIKTELTDGFPNKLFTSISDGISQRSNVILSPYSLSTVLVMTLAGAKHNTAKEIKVLLNLEGKKDQKIFEETGLSIKSLINSTDYVLSIANNMFIQQNFSVDLEFRNLLFHHFGVELEEVNFSDDKARKTINEWVYVNTNKKINKLFQPRAFSPFTKLVLVNTLYFKAQWQLKFLPEDTIKKDFILADGSKVTCDMMNQKSKYDVAELENLNARVLRLPYKGERMSMIIFLPNQGIGLDKVQPELLALNISSLKFFFEEVQVSVPRFKFESTHKLEEPLKTLGLVDLFDGSKADLTGISTVADLHVSRILQKAVIEVNEEGSEASAATGADFVVRFAFAPEHSPFICDRPFLFMIYDEVTKTPIFVGRLSDPTKKE